MKASSSSGCKLRRINSLNINDTRIAGLYDLEHTIGKGHFAVVKLAKHVFTGEKVAVKVIDKTRLDPVSTSHMMQEVRCMKLVQHPNIIRLYEIIDTQTKLFLILELGDYDMYDYITKKEFCKESDAQQYFSQIIKAIDYCHTLHVVHRDLKPENVIFFEKLGMVKLTDFGFSNLFTPGQQLQTSCGSLAYSAPEILLGDAYDAPAVDIWSLGVILYMLVCGRLPFQEANESETLTKILDCKYSMPDHLSPACKQLISRMLVRNPCQRATLAEVIQSPWVVAGDRGHAEVLPLICRDQLPDCAHTTIVEQMVAGQIGTEDEIVSAIDQDEYSYMTATYYLLAERVLSAYRQQQAHQLLLINNPPGTSSEDEQEGCQPNAHNSTGVLSGRSRSNSWRGPSTRRACTILKEESEEELSSYLRSSSRQSSRFYIKPSSRLSSLAPSRANSTDSFQPKSNALIPDITQEEDEPEEGDLLPDLQLHSQYLPEKAPSEALDSPQLAPIRELSYSKMYFNDHLPPLPPPCRSRSRRYQLRNATSLEFPPLERLKLVANGLEPVPNSTAPPTPDWRVKEEEEKEGGADSMAIGDESLGLLANVEAGIHQKPRGFQQLLRRNSSPSVSMFGGVHGLHSSRERISPQAIQELLEFSRLSSGRARSPESRISSRSSSPPCSSGRSSPAITGIVSRLKAANLLPSSSGMRKLSSSPHLLGICEESEDGSTDPLSNPFCTVRLLNKGAANNASFKTHLGGRGTRSASIGMTSRSHKSVDSTPNPQLAPQIGSFSTSFDSGKATAFEPTPLTKFQAVTLANGLAMEVTLKRSNPSISVPAASSQPLSQ